MKRFFSKDFAANIPVSASFDVVEVDVVVNDDLSFSILSFSLLSCSMLRDLLQTRRADSVQILTRW